MEETMSNFSDFTGLFSLGKTLRFELKPIGKTLENIEKKGLLAEDEKRAESYKKVKKLIDEYHKTFIENALSNLTEKEKDGLKKLLDEYFECYNSNRKDELVTCVADLRKHIAGIFKNENNKATFERIFGKELIREDLIKAVKSDEERKLIGEFNDFTTYFTGFNENRKNMYSAEEKSTAIAYRLINENLPKFIDNMKIFEKITQIDEIRSNIEELQKNLSSELNGAKVAEFFELSFYGSLLTQTQIETYNLILGGKSPKQGEKTKGLNEYINLYNQQQSEKKDRLPKFKPLFKQILSDRNAFSWIPEAFVSDNEVLEQIQKCYTELNSEEVDFFGNLRRLLKRTGDFDLKTIYISNDLQLTNISQQMFGSYAVIPNAIEEWFKRNNPPKSKEKAEKYEERIKKMTNAESYSIGFINECLKEAGEEKGVDQYFANCGEPENSRNDLLAEISKQYLNTRDLLNCSYPEGNKLAADKQNVEKIKNFLDAIKDLQRFVKPLVGSGTESDKNAEFYGEFSPLYENFNNFTLLYNKVRNYLTRKPYSTEKIKLNFKNSTLLNGWDLNKESDNTCVLLRKDGMYYLGIMDKNNNKIFASKEIKSDGDCYEKMVYKLLPGPNKMLPKVFFAASRINEFAPSDEILEIRKKETFKKGPNFKPEDLRKWINFMKESLRKNKDWQDFDFHFSDTSSYEDISQFYREVEQQGYKISFVNVSTSYINQLVDEGKLYLFQIYNKDFSSYSKGTPNIHTLYWRMLFDSSNLKDVVYKLNGEAEVFFRKKSITYNDEIQKHGHHYTELKDKFAYPIIKDRRYSLDKFQFHVPMTINFKAGNRDNINALVCDYIKESDDLNIIGIDRGERNLLYVTVIDLNGNIKEQISLNEIVSENKYDYRTDYHKLLDNREKERDAARRSWQSVENIKDLKSGYLSQVIHKISQLMIKYKAIVVLEDLNAGFMRGRQKVEKSVYEQFEKKLIDKLNFLVDKQVKDPNEPGGLFHAYQLTGKFESFKKLGKQSGMLFYVPAWNTSKIDPVTGFVNFFNTRYESIEKAKDFFSKFDSICYNPQKDHFEFAFDYKNFTVKAGDSQTKWSVCTIGSRIETFRNEKKNHNWDNREIDLTLEFKKHFETYKIALNSDLKAEIVRQTSKDFFQRLLYLFKLTVQMRNSITNSSTDYLISPVADKNGNHFDSRKSDKTLPQDADANGAYNIARKGLWLIRQIKQFEGSDWKKFKIEPIKNVAWLSFVQEEARKKG
ncbi:type V CRISPR-associated protein Cas12a/Cpf1 [bacterium]|nr:type V CRISPR-associated protein Cas12a/Cpf1 [bacterium]